MSTISRVAALFSTAALGSMLLTTSVSSVTTIVAAAETNQTQQTNALTLADGTYDTTVAVYKTGTQEDSAMMSYVESKGSMTIKNGSVTLDIAMKGQSQMDMMTGFTVAGHTATKSGTHWTVTLPVSEWAAPFATSMVIDVPAISWHEEPSADLMVTPIVPDKPADTNDTDSDAILSADVPMAASDSMDRFFNPTAKLAVKGDTTDVTLSFKDSVSNMLSMIPEVTFDGITQPLNGKNDITFNIPTKDLKPTNGKSVTLASFTSVPMSPTKGYKSDLTFDLTNVLPAKDLTTGSYKLAVSADGGMDKWFDTNFQTDLGWLTSKVTVAYQESKQGMLSMIPTVTFDNITKPVNGERFVTFEIPTKDLSPDDTNVAKIASFTSVPMSPSKGYQSNLSFDMTPALGSSSETQPEAPAQPEQPTDPETPSVPTTPETDTDESTSNKTGKPAKNAVVRALKILRADNDEASIATQYFHTTIKLAKNADGSYYGYLTTHTPKLMGKNPIRFTDKKHDVSLVETKLVNNYYESTYRMKLQKSELTKPIATTIHVQFTEPIPYNENYEIRLVIGKVLSDKGSDLPTGADKNGTPSGTESNTSQSDVSHETTLTDVNDRTNATTPTTSMGVTGVGTTMPSPIANVPGTAATTTLATTPATQTTATPTTATSLPVAVAAQTPTQPNATTDKPAKSTNKAKHASNSSQSKTAKDTPATEQANTHDDKQPSSIKRAALIGAGVALTAAIGFIGTTMAVNFFKIR